MGINKVRKQSKYSTNKAAPMAILVGVLVLSFLFFAGCGRSSMNYQMLQNLQQAQPPSPNKGLQHQLMVQSSQASLADYRDYKVGSEDLLIVQVYGQEDLERELRVNGRGEITMPLVGVVKVEGLTTKEIEQRLMDLYGSKYLRNPQVTVEVKEFHHQRVAVTGAVTQPGYYEIIGPRTLLEVLAMAGGIANDPNRAQVGDVIHVIRQQNAADVAKTMKTGSPRSFSRQTKTTVINLRRLISGEAPDLNVTVQAGDVVHVPFAGNAYVLGGVRKPGSVAVKQNLTVSQAVALAGGVDPLKGTYKVTVMRFDKQGRPVTIDRNLYNIIKKTEPDLPVKDNDVIMVKGGLKRSLWVIRQILPIPSGGYAIPTQ